MNTPHVRTRLDLNRDMVERNTRLGATITLFHDGTTTEARVSITATNGEQFYGEGFAFLNPKDHYDRTIGEQLAITRAMIDAMSEMEEFLVKEAVKTEQEYQRDAEIAAKQREAEKQRAYDERIAKFREALDSPNLNLKVGRPIESDLDAIRCSDDNPCKQCRAYYEGAKYRNFIAGL